MKINFSDDSFIIFDEIENSNKINITMCGRKNSNAVTMAYSLLDENQVKEIMNFLHEWLDKQKEISV